MVKPVIHGYMDRKGRPTPSGNFSAAQLEIIDSFVINVGPNAPGAAGGTDGVLWSWIMDPTTQAAAIEAIGDDLDYATAHGLKAKLRIFNPQPPALDALAPAISHNGSGTVPDPDDCPGQDFNPAGFTIPNTRFWHDPQYIEAYADLQATLALEFDANPALGDVAFVGGCTQFAEPMIRQMSDIDFKRAQYDTWVAAGSHLGDYEFSDLEALMALMDCHSVWSETRQSLACNPHQTVRIGSPCTGLTRYANHVANARTYTLANHWCDVMGELAIIGNNSLRPNDPGGTGPDSYPVMYDQLVSIANTTGALMYFQTAGTGQLDDELVENGGTYDTWTEVYVATIEKCIDYGAEYIELPGTYISDGPEIPPFPTPSATVASAPTVSTAITITTPKVTVNPTPPSVALAVGDARPKVSPAPVSVGLHVGSPATSGATVTGRDFNGTNSRLYVTTGLPALSLDFIASVWAFTDGQGENALGVPFSVQDASNNVLVEAQMSGGTQGTGSGNSTEPLWSMIVGHTTTAYARWGKPRARNRWTHFVLWWDQSAANVRMFVAGQYEEHETEIDFAQTQSLSGTRRVGTSSTNKLYVGDRQSDNRAFDGRLANLKLVHGANWTDAEVLAYARAMQQSFNATSTPGGSGTVIGAWALSGTGTTAGVVENDSSGTGLNLSTDTGRAPASIAGPTLPTFRSRALHFALTDPPEWKLFSTREFGTPRTVTLSGSYDGTFGTPSSIEARMRGDTTWQTVAGGGFGSLGSNTWTGSFDMRVDGDDEVGSGVEIRANFTVPESGIWNIGLGDLFIVGGQSNGTGLGGNPNDLRPAIDDQGTTIYSGPQQSHLLSNRSVTGAHSWMQLIDPIDVQRAPINIESASRVRFPKASATTGDWFQDTDATMDSADTDYYSAGASASPWPVVAGWWMYWTGRPFGAIPVAKPGAGVSTFERPSSNYSTAYNSSPVPSIFEETVQRLEQITGLTNGTTAVTDSSRDPIRQQAELILWTQGESDAVNNAANSYATTRTNFEAAWLPLLDDYVDTLGTSFMVAVIGQISAADTNDEAPIAVRKSLQDTWGTAIGTGGTGEVYRGPVLYDLVLTSAGGFLHFRYDDTDVTLRTVAKRWAMCLYDLYLSGDLDAHRGPRLVSFAGTGTTYVATFDQNLDADVGGFNGINIRDGSTLRTWVASSPTSTQYTAVRDGSDHTKVNITMGASPSGVLNITLGEINSTNGRRVPMVTHTADGLTVAMPAEVVYRQNVSNDVSISVSPVSFTFTPTVPTADIPSGPVTANATPVSMAVLTNNPPVSASSTVDVTPVSAAFTPTVPTATAPDQTATATPVSMAMHVNVPGVSASSSVEATQVSMSFNVVTPSISVASVVPVAAIAALPGPTVFPATINFDGSASTGLAPLSYAWDFGDGGTATGATPSHTFTAAGDFVVVLTVTQAGGQTDTEQAIMRMRNPDYTPGVPGEGSMIDVIRISVPSTETLVWDGGTNLGEVALPRVSSENERSFFFIIRNKGAGIVYIGPKNETTSATGFPLAVNEQITFQAGFSDRIYATSASTSSLEVLVGST